MFRANNIFKTIQTNVFGDLFFNFNLSHLLLLLLLSRGETVRNEMRQIQRLNKTTLCFCFRTEKVESFTYSSVRVCVCVFVCVGLCLCVFEVWNSNGIFHFRSREQWEIDKNKYCKHNHVILMFCFHVYCVCTVHRGSWTQMMNVKIKHHNFTRRSLCHSSRTFTSQFFFCAQRT